MSIKIEKTTDALLLAKLNHDVQQLHSEIEPDIYKQHSTEGMKAFFESILDRKNIYAYIAYYDEEPAGYVLLVRYDFKDTPYQKSHSQIHIDHICVESKFRGKGIGKVLLDHTKDYAKAKGINRITLDFWTKNKNAGEFFRSQGFSTYNEKMEIKI